MSVDERRRAVEEGLLPVVRVHGSATGPYRLRERMAHYRVPAVSLAITEGDEIAWARAYGLADTTLGTSASERTLFQAASISKPVSAVAVLRLVERRLIDLDRDVNSYLRSWKLPRNEFTREREVTLRHLLSHTAGTTVSGFPGYARGAPLPTTRQILDGEAPANTPPVRVDSPVGITFRYSGGGTTIVQQLLEDVTHTPFGDLVAELVLEPLGMEQSSFAQPLPPSSEDGAASAHEDRRPIPGRWHVYPELAAGGLWTTATDLARFALGVQCALAGRPAAILGRRIAKEMLSPPLDVPVGLGFMLDDTGERLRFAHSGGQRGFTCRLVGYAGGGHGAAVMTNAFEDGASRSSPRSSTGSPRRTDGWAT